MEYYQEAHIIWSQFVPESGQAETMQGELLRAVERLRYEATQNGNANWDQSFETLVNFLSTHLLDESIFSSEKIEVINRVLARIHNYEDPMIDEHHYDILGDRVVDYYRHYGSRPHKKNPRLQR